MTLAIKMHSGTSDAASCRPSVFGACDMYAVFVSGGKQHRVVEGETLKLEKIEQAVGDTIEFDQVLMVGEGADVKIGAPVVEGAKVTAEIVEQGRHAKVDVFKRKRRKGFHKLKGHRQPFTEVEIIEING